VVILPKVKGQIRRAMQFGGREEGLVV